MIGTETILVVGEDVVRLPNPVMQGACLVMMMISLRRRSLLLPGLLSMWVGGEHPRSCTFDKQASFSIQHQGRPKGNIQKKKRE